MTNHLLDAIQKFLSTS